MEENHQPPAKPKRERLRSPTKTSWTPGKSGNILGRIPLPIEIRQARRANFETLFRHVKDAFRMTHEQSMTLLAGPEVSQLEELVHKCIHSATEQGNAYLVKPLFEIFSVAAERVDDPITAEDIELLDKVRKIRAQVSGLSKEDRIQAIVEILSAGN